MAPVVRPSPPGHGSLLPLFGAERLDALLRGAIVRSYSTGERVVRRDAADELHLVLEGEVSLHGRGAAGGPAGLVVEGGAMELESLFARAPDWQYDWVCAKPSKVATVPGTRLDELAKHQPARYRYVERLARHPELQRLVWDLRLFGLHEDHVREAVLSLSRRDVSSRVDLRFDERHLAVVACGEIEIEARDRGPGRAIGRRVAGEPFLLGHSDDLDLEPAAGTAVWLLSCDEWSTRSRVDRRLVDRFLAFVDPLAEADGVVDLERPPASPAVDRIDRAAPAQADEGPEIAAFVARVDELARLHAKRRPFVQQHDQMDCGAACLSMVARFFGRRIGVPAFRSWVHVTRDGASLFSLKKAAAHVGFEAIGVKAGYRDLQRYLTPFIALTEYHFVVVYKVGLAEIVVGDPARGVVTVAAEDFEREWSGVALLLKPTAALARFPDSMPDYLRYADLLRGLRRPTVEALLASCLAFLLSMAAPLFTQFIFDTVLPTRKAGLLNVVALAVLGVTITSHWLEWARNYLLIYVASRADAKFGSMFLRHTFDLPLGFFAARRVGAVTMRLGELARIRRFVTEQLVAMAVSVLSALVYCAVLATYHVGLLLIVSTTVPMALLVVRMTAPRLKRTLQELFKLQARSGAIAFEHFRAFETLKSIGGAIAARWRWDANFSKVLGQRRRSAATVALITSISCMVDGVTNVAILVASAYLYVHRELTLGQVVAANVLVASITAPILALANQWESIAQLGVSFSRVDDVVSSAPEATGTMKPELKGGVEYERVSFQYGSELSPMVLRDVSLTVRPGEVVAFVGASGSGKTTLASLVNLLYVPTSGRVLLDGVDSRSLSLAALRRQVAMVTQDNGMFSGTILENITLGDPAPSLERALRAAKAADAHGFIDRLPNKYSTLLGEGGSGLSGGQRQRLNIARALYRDPAILVLDEATSSLDAPSERRIMDAIKKARKLRTTIMVAHRLNTVVHADRIFVFDGGRLVESGGHAELVAGRGRYFRLFHAQLPTAS